MLTKGEENSLNSKYLFPLIYIIPTYILYTYILWTIYFGKQKHRFQAPFYIIYGISAINYIIHSIFHYINIRSANAPIFLSIWKSLPQKGFIPTFLLILLFYSASAIHLYELLLSFNRFTVFFLKTYYATFWEQKLKYFIAFCILAPFLNVWHLCFTDVQMVLVDPSDPSGFRYPDQIHSEAIQWMSKSRNLTVIIFICAILSFGMNLFVVFKLLRYRTLKAKIGYSQKTLSSQDLQMFFYTILLFGTEIISCIQQYIFAMSTNKEILTVMFNLQYIADISTLAPAWFFFFTNITIRSKLCLKIVLVKQQSIQAITPYNSSNSMPQIFN